MNESTNNPITFQSLNLPEPILRALEEKGYGYPTRVQAEAIGPLMAWKDVIAKAPTGTGKTFAFGIPMIAHVDPEAEEVQGLILAPTRELALQIGDELRSLLSHCDNIRVAVLYGGQSLEPQFKQLKKKPQIVVATPGRLMDHCKRQSIRLEGIRTVILDEADRMLDMGFFKDVTGIIEKIPNRKNLGLFSATMSQEVMTVSWMYQRDEVEITVKADAESKPDIEQYSITVSALEKLSAVRWILYLGGYERVIIFCNTKVLCQSLSDELRRVGVDADCIHGNIPQTQRERTMKSFRKGKLPVLIATDVASRGIDVDDVDCVINYDVPQENEYYIHRIGRTGRAKRKGVSYTVIGSFPEQARLDEIAKYSRFMIQPVAITESGFVPVERRQQNPVLRRRR